MPRAEIDFSEFAAAFYNIIEGGKGSKAKFVKTLLYMGVSDNGKNIMDELFPTETTPKGNTIIKPSKSDQLRKYLRGENGISEIADEIYAVLDHESYDDYIKELEDYEDSKLIEFAQQLQLDTDLDDIYEVREAIAACYYSIIEKASVKSVATKDKSNGSKDIILSYTITETEKKAIIKLCELIKKSLISIKRQTDVIDKKQFELKSLTNSEKDAKWKPHLEYDIASLKKRFDKSYSELEKLCVDTVELLDPKKGIHKSFGTIVSIARNISSDEYKITCPDKFNYNSFSVMISRFNDSYNQILRDIDKL